jgi:hypothetical protein
MQLCRQVHAPCRQYVLNTRLGKAQSKSGSSQFRSRETALGSVGNRTAIPLYSPARKIDTVLADLYRLHTAAYTGMLDSDLEGKPTKREKKFRTFFCIFPKRTLTATSL